tara:strand:- start:7097 stop:8044 length:948 start_codon:yes stop_codon:yes gene_type:complete
MPKVGDKEFPYTPEGIAAAKAESENMGIPVNDGANRSVTEYAGGGKTGYNMIGMQKPMMGHGGKMMKYEEGGLAGDLNGDGKLSIAEKNKLKIAKRKAKMKKGIEEGTKKRKKVKEGVKKTVKKVGKFLEDKNLKPRFKKRELSEREQSAKDKRAERIAARKAARAERRAARKAKREETKAYYKKEREAMKAKKDKKPAAKKPAAKKPVVSQPNQKSAFDRNQPARDAKKVKAESLKKSKKISKEAEAASNIKLEIPKIKMPTNLGFTVGKSKPKPKPKPEPKSDFGSSFSSARKAGKDTFMYKGKKYTTKLKGE